MIGFPSGVRVHLALEPHDMRKSFNGLAAIASATVARGLESGALFVFTNKRRNRLKILYYDRTGVCVLACSSCSMASTCAARRCARGMKGIEFFFR